MRTYILKAKFFRSNGLFYLGTYSDTFSRTVANAARFPNKITAQKYADELGTNWWDTLESLTPIKGDTI